MKSKREFFINNYDNIHMQSVSNLFELYIFWPLFFKFKKPYWTKFLYFRHATITFELYNNSVKGVIWVQISCQKFICFWFSWIKSKKKLFINNCHTKNMQLVPNLFEPYLFWPLFSKFRKQYWMIQFAIHLTIKIQ